MNMRFITFTVLCLTMLGGSCKKDENDRVPSVPVDITLLLSLPSYSDLTIPGGWAYISGGSRGLVVYRVSTDEFMALDRHCPYQVNDRRQIFVEENNIIGVDSVGCGSKFAITDGSIAEGPASYPLTKYNTSYNSVENKLRISN